MVEGNFNPYHAAGMSRRQLQNFTTFSKTYIIIYKMYIFPMVVNVWMASIDMTVLVSQDGPEPIVRSVSKKMYIFESINI